MGDTQRDLELLIEECKKNSTTNHLLGVLRLLQYIDVIIPLSKTQPMIPYLLKDPYHDYLMCVFTKAEYIPTQWQNSKMLKMTFSQAIRFIENNYKVEMQILIDPYHQNFILEKEAITLFKNLK